MKLRFLFKDPNSISDNCPAVYETSRAGEAGLAIQGKYLGAEGEAQLLNRASDEGGLFISHDLGKMIAEYYNSRA